MPLAVGHSAEVQKSTSLPCLRLLLKRIVRLAMIMPSHLGSNVFEEIVSMILHVGPRESVDIYTSVSISDPRFLRLSKP